jgi:PAS domain S-box-containing protein
VEWEVVAAKAVKLLARSHRPGGPPEVSLRGQEYFGLDCSDLALFLVLYLVTLMLVNPSGALIPFSLFLIPLTPAIVILMLKFGIRVRLLVLLLAATTLPLLSLNFFWSRTGRARLFNMTKSEQVAVTERAADNVNNFVNEKIRSLIIHSQSASVQQFDVPRATLEMSALLYQDKDLLDVSLADSTGKERISLDNALKAQPLRDISSSDGFRVVSYLAAKEYISPVTADREGRPTVTIVVPLISFTKPQDLSTISTAEPGVVRQASDVKGALIAKVNLDDLWHSVLASAPQTGGASSDNSGYAYVIDNSGTIIAHPDAKLTNTQANIDTPIIKQFLDNISKTEQTNHSLEGLSEKKVMVLGTYQKIPSTNWAVIFQEPLQSIYHDVNQLSRLGLAMTLLAVVIMIALSYILSRYITSPVLAIGRTAEKIGGGDLNATVQLKQHDEIGALAHSINTMGQNLRSFIGRLEAERNQLEAILNSTSDGIIALDEYGNILLANRAASQLVRLPSNELLGKALSTVCMWRKGSDVFVLDYTHPGTERYDNLIYKDPAGADHYIDLLVTRIPNSHEAVQTIVTMHDLTKSRELDSMKVDFVSMAAHELRTPISAVRGFLELMLYKDKTESALPEQTKHYILQARKSTMDLIGLINNLLNISRIERGALTLNLEKLDWAETISSVMQGYQFNAQEKNITLKYEGPTNGCFILADSVAVQEVLNNVVSNAIKYTNSGGSIVVRMSEKDGHYLTQVTDTGIGIPANALKHLFTKFYRVNGGLASGSGGTGLGLFISKSIVDRHGGTIWVDSQEGHGSTFSFTFPIFSNERQAAYQAQQQTSQTTRRHRGWITKNITR